MSKSVRFLTVACLMAAALGVLSPAARAQAPAGKTVVLDTAGFWRMHHLLSEPVIRGEGGLKAAEPAGAEIAGWKVLLAKPTAAAPQGWAEPNFDDSQWYRSTVGGACRTPFLQRLCLRGVFTVNEPQAVKGLAVSVDFYGGAVVYLNGKELGRQAYKGAPGDAGALADDYPVEAFVKEDGNLITVRGNEVLVRKDAATPETLKRIDSRTRKLEMPIPAGALRKGTNVLAVEIVRAPYDKVLDKFKVVQSYKSNELTHDMSWNTCELRRIQLTASAVDGLAPAAVRPGGVQVWNSDPLATDFDMDFAGSAEDLRAIRLSGARNGVYSGKVVVGSTSAIKGLKATPGDLASASGPASQGSAVAGKIPAAAVRIRYALPWDTCRTSDEGCFDSTAYPADAKPLWALVESAPAEVPVYEKKVEPLKLPTDRYAFRYGSSLEVFRLNAPGQPTPVNGAVAPVWVTVKVPKDAKPGLYRGQVAVEVAGKKVADVPVELHVADWVVPDPAEYETWVDLVQSPDALSLQYNVPLWGEKHFELIGKSMKYLAEMGCHIVYVPLIAHTNLGNAESMVRWIKKGDKYEYDFTAMDKYLDAAEKAGIKIKVVELNVWDLYTYAEGGKVGRFVGGASGYKGGIRGPQVTVLDPSSGKTEIVQLPPYLDPASKALWQPLFAALRERLKKRGLEDAMQLGMITDDQVSKEQVQFFQSIGADLPWFSASHGRHDGNASLYGIAGVGYQAHAFGVDVGYVESLRGWARPSTNTLYERWAGFPFTMPTRWRAFAEYAVTGNTRGVGRIGADYWRVVPDKSGQKVSFPWERYPEASWHQLSLVSFALAAGPDSAVASQRFEALREGVQDAEAIIQLERALSDKAQADKLGPDLAKKAKDALADHHKAMWLSVATFQMGPAADHAFSAWRGCYYAGVNGYRWFQGSDWQERNLRLYSVAGEVAKKLGK